MAIYNERIKLLRAENDMTLKELSKRIGVTEATIQRYETGKGIKTVPYDVIEKLANIFEVEPMYILGWKEQKDMEPYSKELINSKRLKKLVSNYKKLSDKKKDFIDEMIMTLLDA